MSKRLVAGLSTLLFLMASANVLLIRQNLQMRQALNRLEPHGLKEGEKVPPFTASGLHGEPIDVNYTGDGRKTVLFFFTPTCPFCRQQFPYWKEILGRVDGERFQVIGLVDQSEDKTKVAEYMRAMGCSTDSQSPLRIAFVTKDIRRNYKLSETPITLIVANDGTVEKAWAGRWSGGDAATASTILGFNFSLH
jgi:peroxiredoxin